MKKGISAIIATILLLLITIALAGTAYIFTSGMLSGRTQKAISILSAECTGDDITLIISNDGTEDITDTEVTVIVDTTDASAEFRDDFDTITPHSTIVATDDNTNFSSGVHSVIVTSPSNSAEVEVYCAT